MGLFLVVFGTFKVTMLKSGVKIEPGALRLCSLLLLYRSREVGFSGSRAVRAGSSYKRKWLVRALFTPMKVLEFVRFFVFAVCDVSWTALFSFSSALRGGFL